MSSTIKTTGQNPVTMPKPTSAKNIAYRATVSIPYVLVACMLGAVGTMVASGIISHDWAIKNILSHEHVDTAFIAIGSTVGCGWILYSIFGKKMTSMDEGLTAYHKADISTEPQKAHRTEQSSPVGTSSPVSNVNTSSVTGSANDAPNKEKDNAVGDYIRDRGIDPENGFVYH